VSTGKTGLLNENSKTMEAVLGPTPAMRISHSRALATGSDFKKSNSILPRSRVMCRSARLMRGAFCCDKPDERIALAMAPVGASRTCSQATRVRAARLIRANFFIAPS